jgi:hypothetical protein
MKYSSVATSDRILCMIMEHILLGMPEESVHEFWDNVRLERTCEVEYNKCFVDWKDGLEYQFPRHSYKSCFSYKFCL